MGITENAVYKTGFSGKQTGLYKAYTRSHDDHEIHQRAWAEQTILPWPVRHIVQHMLTRYLMGKSLRLKSRILFYHFRHFRVPSGTACNSTCHCMVRNEYL